MLYVVLIPFDLCFNVPVPQAPEITRPLHDWSGYHRRGKRLSDSTGPPNPPAPCQANNPFPYPETSLLPL